MVSPPPHRLLWHLTLPAVVSLWGCSTVFCSYEPKPQQRHSVQLLVVPEAAQCSTNDGAQDSLGAMVSFPPGCCYSRWESSRTAVFFSNWFSMCVPIAALHRSGHEANHNEKLALIGVVALFYIENLSVFDGTYTWFSFVQTLNKRKPSICFILLFNWFAPLLSWMSWVAVQATDLRQGGFNRSHASNTEPFACDSKFPQLVIVNVNWL